MFTRSLRQTHRRLYSTASKGATNGTKSTKAGFFALHWKLYAATFVAGGLTANFVPVTSILQYYLNSNLPKDDDPQGQQRYIDALESKLQHLKLVKKLRAHGASGEAEFKEYRDWNYISDVKALSEWQQKKVVAEKVNEAGKAIEGKNREVSDPPAAELAKEVKKEDAAADSKIEDANSGSTSLTEETLTAPGGFSIRPLIFNNPKTNETIAIIYVGSKLCGYPFIVHGGILATVLDELFKKSVGFKVYQQENSSSSNSNVSDTTQLRVTHLDLNYRFPTIANNFIVIKSHLDESDAVGHNEVGVKGTIESINGKLLVKGAATVSVEEREEKNGNGGNGGKHLDSGKVKDGLKKLWPKW